MQIAAVLDRLAIHARDDISLLQSCLFRRRARNHFGDQGALVDGDVEAVLRRRRHVLHLDAEEGGPSFPGKRLRRRRRALSSLAQRGGQGLFLAVAQDVKGQFVPRLVLGQDIDQSIKVLHVLVADLHNHVPGFHARPGGRAVCRHLADDDAGVLGILRCRLHQNAEGSATGLALFLSANRRRA